MTLCGKKAKINLQPLEFGVRWEGELKAVP